MNFKNREFSISFNIDIDDIEESNNKNMVVIQSIRTGLGLLYCDESKMMLERDYKKNCITTILQGSIVYAMNMMISSPNWCAKYDYYILTNMTLTDKILIPNGSLSSIISIIKAKQTESCNE